MEKIFYDENGWVCNRYPYNISVTNENRYVEVDDELANETFSCEAHKAWRVVNGELVVEQYEEVPRAELNKQRYYSLKQQLADMDYKTSKYVDGDYTEQEWDLIVAERKRLRSEINNLEQQLF